MSSSHLNALGKLMDKYGAKGIVKGLIDLSVDEMNYEAREGSRAREKKWERLANRLLKVYWNMSNIKPQ